MSFGQREFANLEKPEIEFPDHEVPTELVIQDLVEGTGAEAQSGSTVSAHYVGVAFSTGEEFDSSYGRGAPLDFRVGVGQVIQGWDQGLLGMKVGGRRRLEIPSGLAYGERGAGGAIGPNEALIFVVDLVGVRG
ncbi:MAG: FKBP-type peptidyl-prolyl cis-trans isomerase [Actinomycetales bacterium]|jgi:peptidylprolyl isomerase